MDKKAIFVFLLLAAGVFSATIPITDCSTLDSSNDVYVLQNNVGGADCIYITGENITFDLNGYNVDGYGGYGIVMEDASGILVENGTVNTANGGIYVLNSFDSTIRNLNTSAVSNNAIYVGNSHNISISKVNYIRCSHHTGTALVFANTTNSVIEDSACTGACGYNDEYDWGSSCVNLVDGSNNNIIQNNYMYDAHRNGVYIYQSNNNTISGNTVEHSHWYGIAVREGENNSITNNRFVDSGLVHIYFEIGGRNNNYTGNENEDGDPILIFMDQENMVFENNQTSEILLFNTTNATFRNITMVKGGINILGNGTANITVDGFEIRDAGAAIFMIPGYETVEVLNGTIMDSTYGFYGYLDRDVYVENLNGTNISRYPIGLDVSSGSACAELLVSNYTVDGNPVVYTTLGGFSPPSGTYSQIFMCGVSTANISDAEIRHGLFSYYSNGLDARRIAISDAYIPVKLVGTNGAYFEDIAINNARVEGMDILDSNNTYIYRTNITTIPDPSIPTFDLVDYTFSDVGIYTSNVDGFVFNASRIENSDASIWMKDDSKNVSIHGSTFRTGLHGIIIDNVQYGMVESNIFSDFSTRGIAVGYANQTEVGYNNLTNTGADINNGAINVYGGRNISVYRNNIDGRSGIIFTSWGAGSPDYLTEFSVYENDIKNIPGTAGVYVVASHYGSTTEFGITDNNISDSLDGIRLLNAKNGTICRNRIEDSTYGVYAIDSGELYFCDSGMQNITNFPVFIDYSNTSFCGSTNITNTTHENEEVGYYNSVSGLVIENISNQSEIILCDVNDSTIKNVEMHGNEGELGILAVLSNRNEFYGNSGDEVYSMTYLLRSNGNNLSNYTLNNAQIGIMADLSSENRIENSILVGDAGDGIRIYRDSHNNTVYNLNITGQPVVIDEGSSSYVPQSNAIYGNRMNSSEIRVYGSKYTDVHENVIHNGRIYMHETTEMNASYNNFTGTCAMGECIYCRGYSNIVYKNLLNLDAEPTYGVLVVGTTNNISRNYFANTIVRVDSGNTGCGNLYGILNVSGPTGITNRSCFSGNITQVEVVPNPIYESSNASCRILYTHEDPYDAESVEFRWYVNGTHLPAYDGYGSGARDSWIETNVSLPANESSAGDNITCEVHAYDGTYWTEWKNETVQVVPDTCGIDVNETEVDFGPLTTNVLSAEKSIRITNPGTVPANFSINGTDWTGPGVFSSTRTRWNTTSGSYETKTPVDAAPVVAYPNLPGGGFFDLYLQLYTPIGQQNGTYNQTITIIAECP